MPQEDKNLTRREFIKKAGVTGLTTLFAVSAGVGGDLLAEEAKKEAGDQKPQIPDIPMRKFGKTGVEVSILSLGGIVDFTSNQILLKKSLDWNISYWDTANSYNGGNSELGIGKFFEKFPEARKKIFLVTKGGSRDLKELTKMLNLSLERMKTDYIDLYFLHHVRNVTELTPELKAWVENAKKEKKIKFFGFSTHSNMGTLMQNASTLGWIDGIMTTYNYKVMFTDEMKKGVEACHKAGIGVTAMKTQARRSRRRRQTTEDDLSFAEKFIQKGYSPEQAKLKIVWENEQIASICSQMTNLTIMSANMAASVDKTKLELSDLGAFKTHAAKTCNEYCAGCSEICEKAMGGDTCIAEVMRYMMYHHGYGDTKRAREEFASLPARIRSNMAQLDYSPAEQVCPQKIAIGEIMREASGILA